MKTPLYFQIYVKNQKDPFFKNPKTPLKKGWDDTMGTKYDFPPTRLYFYTIFTIMTSQMAINSSYFLCLLM